MNTMRTISNPDQPVILFIPEAGIYPYMRALAIIGDAIQKAGGRVLVTRDTGQMFRSPIMPMHDIALGDPENKLPKSLRITRTMLKKVQRTYGFGIIDLSELVDDVLIQEIHELVDAVPNDAIEDIHYRGFPVGKLSMFDFILETKAKYTKNQSEHATALYKEYVKNTALALALTESMCEKYNPSLFLTFNEYAQCQAVRYGAERNNVKRMAVTNPGHFNADASRAMIWESTCEYWRYTHCQNWNTVRDVPVTPKDVLGCWDDTLYRLYAQGSHIFSPRKNEDPRSVFESLGLDADKKTVVVYTSTIDERDSIELAMRAWKEDPGITDAFTNQIEWLSFLSEYATENDQVQIVVRVHPREGVRRAGFESEHSRQLKAVLTDKQSESFKMIWPDDPISSYDLMELADVCLVSWSLMGQEAARLGVPVLAMTSNMTYPDDDFIQTAQSKEEYKSKLDAILTMQYGWEHLLKAVRFYHWRLFMTSFDFGDSVTRVLEDHDVWPRVPEDKVEALNDILSGKKDLIAYNKDVWFNTLFDTSLQEESEAMRLGIRRLLDVIVSPPKAKKHRNDIGYRILRKLCSKTPLKHLFMYTKENIILEDFVDYTLVCGEDISRIDELQQKSAADEKLRFAVRDGNDVVLIYKGLVHRRMSPVLSRLITLYETSEST